VPEAGELLSAVKKLGLEGRIVCLHSSMKSFGCRFEGGASAVIRAFTDSGCTLIVPSFSYRFTVRPPENMRPAQNGYDYENMLPESGIDGAYTPETDEISAEYMGQVPLEAVKTKGRARGNHPVCSFAGVGPLAAEIIGTQSSTDVFAPLRAIADKGGYAVMMGTGLATMTALHLAEQMAGRNMFIRWAKSPDGGIIECECGGCSEGFGNFEPVVSGMERRGGAGKSVWRAFPLAEFLEEASAAIRKNPAITHCRRVFEGNKPCMLCEDAVKGGCVRRVE